MLTLGISTSGKIASVALVTTIEQTNILKGISEKSFFSEKNCVEFLMPTISKMFEEVSGLTLKDVELIAIDVGPGGLTGIKIGVTTAKTLAQFLRIPVVSVSSLLALSFNCTETKYKIGDYISQFSKFNDTQSFKGQAQRPAPTISNLQSSVSYTLCPMPYAFANSICCLIKCSRTEFFCALYKDSSLREPLVEERLFNISNFSEIQQFIKKSLSEQLGMVVLVGDGIPFIKDYIGKEFNRQIIETPETMWYPRASIIGSIGILMALSGKLENYLTLVPNYLCLPRICKV